VVEDVAQKWESDPSFRFQLSQSLGWCTSLSFLQSPVLLELTNKLPREAVDAPSLAVFKARLNGALSNLV